jgi:hypothetical protein
MKRATYRTRVVEYCGSMIRQTQLTKSGLIRITRIQFIRIQFISGVTNT